MFWNLRVQNLMQSHPQKAVPLCRMLLKWRPFFRRLHPVAFSSWTERSCSLQTHRIAISKGENSSSRHQRRLRPYHSFFSWNSAFPRMTTRKSPTETHDLCAVLCIGHLASATLSRECQIGNSLYASQFKHHYQFLSHVSSFLLLSFMVDFFSIVSLQFYFSFV